MGLKMDDEKLLKVFALSDKNGNNLIEFSEFTKAVLLIKQEIAKETLRELGITRRDFIIFGTLSLIFLIFSLFFIFFGVLAFGKAEGFSAIVSSLLPLIAGGAVMSRRIGIEGKINRAKEIVKQFIGVFKRD